MNETPNVQHNPDEVLALGAMAAVAMLDPSQKRLVQSTALNVVQSIDNQTLQENNQDLNHELSIDKKTGLYNESFWKKCVGEELEKLGPNETLTVQVADVNGFKQVNDELGHDAGDELLDLIGQAFNTVFKRKGDISAHGSREDSSTSVARLGGDEFATMYVNNTNGQRQIRTEEEAAEEAAEQSKRINDALTKILAGTRFERFGTSLSIGSAISKPGDTVETIFARADSKMFVTKYEGKEDQITDEDREQLKLTIPILDKLNTRVPDWLRKAIFPTNGDSQEAQKGNQAQDENNYQEVS